MGGGGGELQQRDLINAFRLFIIKPIFRESPPEPASSRQKGVGSRGGSIPWVNDRLAPAKKGRPPREARHDPECVQCIGYGCSPSALRLAAWRSEQIRHGIYLAGLLVARAGAPRALRCSGSSDALLVGTSRHFRPAGRSKPSYICAGPSFCVARPSRLCVFHELLRRLGDSKIRNHAMASRHSEALEENNL